MVECHPGWQTSGGASFVRLVEIFLAVLRYFRGGSTAHLHAGLFLTMNDILACPMV